MNEVLVNIREERQRRRENATDVDVLVIGGGVNGLAVAWSAALSGLTVLVVDKGDWGSGTSSWSSRLIHGGLKYLEKFDVPLVRESLADREWLLRAAPHLLKPMPFLLPYYRGQNFPRSILRLGMVAYDILSFDKSLPWHRHYSRQQVLEKWPGIKTEGLLGGSVYYDAQITDSERMCVEMMVAARNAGATTLNYARVDSLIMEGTRVTGARIRDLIADEEFSVAARVVVNVAGAWIDDVLAGTPAGQKQWIGGTKGTHLAVTPPTAGPETSLYFESDDARPMLIIPWKGMYLIGSTDKRVSGGFDELSADQEEIDYILYEINKIYPEWQLTEKDIHYWYTGVRPLPYVSAARTADISRRHDIHDHRGDVSGLLTVTGGKLTTFRALSDHVMKKVAKMLGVTPQSIRHSMFPGAPTPGTADTDGVSVGVAGRLKAIYGELASTIEALIDSDSSLGEIIDPSTFLTRAEVVYAVQHEEAVTVSDVIARRVVLGLNADLGECGLEAVADEFRKVTGLSAGEVAEQVNQYRRYTKRFTVKAPL